MNKLEKLIKISYEIRKDVINMLTKAGSGHLGGSLGMADIFAVLYFSELNHDPLNPNWEMRDRVIVSNGHIAPVWYATLSNSGYFDKKELFSLRQFGSRLQGHPSKLSGLHGIESSSGSLGQGLSVATGMALASKFFKKNYRIFCLMGDGELQEGNVWEAFMSAGHYKLDNLLAIVDRNRLQIDGNTENVMSLEPLKNKIISFNWNVLECDGNDINDLLCCFKSISWIQKPTCVIANTTMGKGVKSIENNHLWHGKAPNSEEAINFLIELEEYYKNLFLKIN
jgi:transketolase